MQSRYTIAEIPLSVHFSLSEQPASKFHQLRPILEPKYRGLKLPKRNYCANHFSWP